MQIGQLNRDMVREMAGVIHTSPWRTFCRGIFTPCTQISSDDFQLLFEDSQYDPNLSFALTENDKLTGFAMAKMIDSRIEIFLLEAKRDDAYSGRVDLLLQSVFQEAEKRSITHLAINANYLMSTGIDLKDNAAMDAVLKMGFWQNVLIAAEMRIELKGYSVPEKIHTREKKLEDEGIIIRPCTGDDLAILDEMCSWQSATGGAWGKLLRDVIESAGCEFIIIAVQNKSIIGYSTFFARTIMSAMPECGPVFVKPEFRGKGIAGIMLTKSLMQIVNLAIAPQVQLSCYPNKFVVYPKLGFYFTNKYMLHADSKPVTI